MRHAPDMPLPAAPYLPGSGARRPQLTRPPAEPLALETWREHRGLAFGFDLFERELYWEAHEVWEDAWQLCANGPERELLRGLIQVAASRLQERLGRPGGATRLRDRATRHLRAAAIRPVVAGVWIDEVITTGRLRWRCRSRDLFGVPTDLVVQPLVCVFAPARGAIVQRTPGYQDYYGGRAYYDDRVTNPVGARAAASEALAGDGPGYLNLIWEVEEPGPAAFAGTDSDDLDRFSVLVGRSLSASPPRPRGVEIRPLESDADWVRLSDFAGRLAVASWGSGAREFSRWRYQHYRESVALWGGAFFGAFEGDQLVGSLGILDGGSLLRYQDVQVAASHRRRGIAGYLCAHAFRAAGAGDDKPAVIVAESDSIAEGLYGRLGFVHCSTQHALRWLHEG